MRSVLLSGAPQATSGCPTSSYAKQNRFRIQGKVFRFRVGGHGVRIDIRRHILECPEFHPDVHHGRSADAAASRQTPWHEEHIVESLSRRAMGERFAGHHSRDGRVRLTGTLLDKCAVHV